MRLPRLRFVHLGPCGDRLLPYVFFALLIAFLWHETSKRSQIMRTLYVAERLEANILALETSQRGYLLTGDPDFAVDFYSNRAQVGHWTANLRLLLKGDTEDLDKLSQVDRLAGQKISEMAATVELSKAGKKQEALAIVNTHVGQRYMSGIRNLMQDIRVSKEVELTSTF